GTIRDDATGDQQMDPTESGIPGVVVFLDQDNDGVLAPTEPQTVSDETGRYAFDVPAGIYVVRQKLGEDAQHPDAQNAAFVQTAPFGNPQLANNLSSPYGQWNDQFNPIEYAFDWSGTIENAAAELLPDEWQSSAPGSRVSFSMKYAFNPSAQPEFNELQQTFNYSAIDHYSLRFESGADAAGVGEIANIDQSATRISVEPEFQTVQFSVPLQTGVGLRLEVDALLLPNIDPFVMPRASEIVEPQQFRIVQGDGPFQTTIIDGVIESQQYQANRAVRFGHVVRLPQDQGGQFDFWNTRDDDEDGLPTAWEEQGGGVDINGDGVIDLDLFARGADPFHKDVFVEVDAMAGRAPLPASVDLSDIPGVESTETVLDQVIRSFADSPVDNPDGLGGIRLHIELDESDIPLAPFTDPETPWAEFDAIKGMHVGGQDARIASGNRDNIVEARRFVYRYGLFADTRASGSTGMAEQPGNDFFVTLGDWLHSNEDGSIVGGGSPEQQAGTFMHELGHTFGLRHGGNDDLNYKPNYLSVMNYHWQVPNSNVGWTLDYSPETLPSLDPNSLNEPSGIGASPRDNRREVFVGPTPYRRVPVDATVDWNRDGDTIDPDVAARIYRTTFRDADGVSRTYDMLTNGDAIGGASFDPAIHSHNDWALRAEDMMFSDDPEFSDGVHTCDNPEAPETPCYEDLTDFFTLSISPDLFEPETVDEPIDISIFDLDDWFVVNLDDGTWTGGFSIHNEFDHDTFRWAGGTQGQFRASATFVPGGTFTPELYLLDANNNQVGTELFEDGRTSVVVDLDAIESPESLRIVVKNSGVDVDPNSQPSLDVDPATGYRYFLEIYGPRSATLPGTIWHGASNSDGTPGDGMSWNDANNWSVDGVADSASSPTSDHTFLAASGATTIELAQDRTVKSLQFRDSFQVCSDPCDYSLTVTSGIVDVFPNVTATVHANIGTAGPNVLRKRNQGELILDGVTSSMHVSDGKLAGTFTVDGNLHVGPKGTLSPGAGSGTTAPSSATQQVVIEGTVVIDVDSSSNDLVMANEIRFGPSSVLEIRADSAVAAANTEIRRPIVEASIELEATTDLATFGFVRGADRTPGLINNHAGAGAFVVDIIHQSDQVDAILYQAGAGDANGDGIFNSTDLILVFNGGLYEKDRPATWLHGDWNGDGRFESGDLVVALQQGTYSKDAVPQRHVSRLAASILDELDRRDRNERRI
ncbi:hypothetical protein ACFL2H_06600, partial [Planctomycetota bacterium]